MASEHLKLWDSDAEAKMLENRMAGFWNPDYFNRIILPLLDLKPGTRVLDVGAGTGSLTLLLAQALPDINFLGIDLTPKMITDAQALAKSLNIKNVEFQVADALLLPFDDASFDATVCQTLLIHLGDPAQAISEMSRVLKPGGTFMAAEFNLLNAEWPITEQAELITDQEVFETARYIQMLIKGYRQLGQGNLKAGGQVPFMAIKAGLEILDIRINDRVPHAFPPHRKPMEKAALVEAQSWGAVFKDPSYHTFASGSILAGGGTESDVAGFISILDKLQETFFSTSESDFSFLWLINPVLLITIAQKP